MKSRPTTVLASVLLAIALPSVAQVVQEETTKTTTTTTNGTLNEVGPERIIVRTETNSSPLTYSVSKTTTYVDDTGAPVAMDTVKSGLPITVHYTRSGDTLVANRVVVHKRTTTTPGAETETTTTTTRGTITEFEPSERVVIRSTTSNAPVRYRFTKSTTYVDRAGNPVAVKTIKTGLPVTVHYLKEGNDLVATRVVVDSLKEGDAPGETTRTETTTTTSSGTIGEFKNDRVTIRTEADAAPMTYSFSKTTTYVDEDGNPVTVESVRSGTPATVYYTTEGDRRVATKVVIRKGRK